VHYPKFTNAPNSGHGTLRPEHLSELLGQSFAFFGLTMERGRRVLEERNAPLAVLLHCDERLHGIGPGIDVVRAGRHQAGNCAQERRAWPQLVDAAHLGDERRNLVVPEDLAEVGLDRVPPVDHRAVEPDDVPEVPEASRVSSRARLPRSSGELRAWAVSNRFFRWVASSSICFTWDSMATADLRVKHLRRRMSEWAPAAPSLGGDAQDFDARFRDAVADDLDLPSAAVVLSQTVSSET
jgi:hypothetical protein